MTLVPTPIGNLGDITLRALECLRAADAVAAEDTRRARQLLAHFAIEKPLVRLDAHTMRARAAGVLERYPRLAYVSDAGSPGLSDPGADLAEVALALGGRVEALPGATALIPALTVSGLPTARFTFHGFLPRGGAERRARLEEIAASAVTSVAYESPHRLAATLRDLAAACGEERRCAVARELTKLHEEVFRGTLRAAAERFADGARGEIVVVVAPRDASDDARVDVDAFEARAREWAALGADARDIRSRLMRAGLDRNRSYALALEATRGTGVREESS